jgi:hemoglobin
MRQFLTLFFVLILATPAWADSLFDQLGGMDAVTRIAHRTIEISAKDPRIKDEFKFVKLNRVKDKLALQFCELSGGPCKYDGDPMKPLHKPMKLTTADFNALVEALQQAMREEGVPFRAQNKLVAILAPMHKDIVTVR